MSYAWFDEIKAKLTGVTENARDLTCCTTSRKKTPLDTVMSAPEEMTKRCC